MNVSPDLDMANCLIRDCMFGSTRAGMIYGVYHSQAAPQWTMAAITLLINTIDRGQLSDALHGLQADIVAYENAQK